MTIFSSFFSKRSTTAPAARERLQVLLAHERASIGQSDLVAVLREEILAVIAKHVAIDRDQVKVKMQKGDAVSTLEVDIELPVLPSRTSVADAPDRAKFAQIRRA